LFWQFIISRVVSFRFIKQLNLPNAPGTPRPPSPLYCIFRVSIGAALIIGSSARNIRSRPIATAFVFFRKNERGLQDSIRRNTMAVRQFASALASVLILASCGQGEEKILVGIPPETNYGGVTSDMLINAAQTPQEWLTYGGTYDEQRYARLSQVKKDNLDKLGIAWTYDLATSRGVESTPIVVDGVMYVTGAWSIVYALDAKTGEELWVYDPEVSGEAAARSCCDVVNRGVAVYGDKVYVGVFDGRLEALDAKTGKLVWSTITVDQSKPYSITGAPRVVKGNVLIGNGGSELGVRGYVSAYDAETGDLSWRFYITPNPNKQPDGAASDAIFASLANDTWGDSGAWKTDGGGGTPWDSIVYDDENNTVLIGTGNASPFNEKIRDPDGNGDNLFLSSILALDADTGAYKWHFQTTPRDIWDYTATQSIILADLPLGENGAKRRVVMQAPKNGFFYVLDATTGEFISGAPFAHMTWATGLDENGRPIENPAARDTEAGFLAIPAPSGAHNWHPMAFSPDTGLVYIPSQQMTQFIQDRPADRTNELRWNLGYDFSGGLPPTYPPGTLAAVRKDLTGTLLAWDPVKQEARWTFPHPGPFNGGILTTEAGLVFQGDIKGNFFAFDATTGKKVWGMNLKSGVQSAPATYEIDGEQYIAVTTGWGGSWALNWGFAWDEAVAPDVGRVFVFKLGGTGDVPDPMQSVVEKTPKAESFGTPEMVQAGFVNYSENCMVCHGPLAISSGVLPDLRWSPVSANKDTWHDIVINGALTDNGMVSFKPNLTDEAAESIRAYVLDQAWLAVTNGDIKQPQDTGAQ
jgi:quinohemoprotein ethanol dehydrogenase